MKDAKDNEGRSVEVLGRAGIKFIDNGKQYFINSEMLVSAEADLVIYSDSVRYFKEIFESRPVFQDEKAEIVKTVVKLLQLAGIRAEIQL